MECFPFLDVTSETTNANIRVVGELLEATPHSIVHSPRHERMNTIISSLHLFNEKKKEITRTTPTI